MNKNIVSLRKVSIDYKMKRHNIRAVNQVDFDIKEGSFTALVGESGSGKTTLASAIIGSISEPGEVSEGELLFNNGGEIIDVLKLKGESMRKFKWEKVSMVFQAAQSALNPVMKIYDQFKETAIDHQIDDKDWIEQRVIELLEYVKLDAKRVMHAYPHELSGGMKQRVMIAFAMFLNPKLIILDEPTTALDVITQDHIFKLLRKINKEFNISMLLLTHDIGIVAKFTDYVGVMNQGEIVEFGETFNVFTNSKHAYTKLLMDSTPSLTKDITLMKGIHKKDVSSDIHMLKRGEAYQQQELMRLENIQMEFSQGSGLSKRKLHVLKDINLTIQTGEIVTLVGESGSGKTTLGKIITGLYKPVSGDIYYLNQSMGGVLSKKIQSYDAVQFVQQDSYAALNPVRTIYQSLYAPLKSFNKKLNKHQIYERIYDLMSLVGLNPVDELLWKYPHQLSGGQRQRVLIARALTSQPKLIVADEPVSMIDVSLRLSILNLMNELNKQLSISFIYITHDLSTARYIAEGGRIFVMYKGEIVESGPIEEIIVNPKHEYTKELIRAVPDPNPQNNRRKNQ
ncbi:ABC transporter ATP-binding protein [Acholeplasma laidlawii]|uniref:ABC transporter ATP-binding protein n=1 Tax=Acholeplasma laidlawii TaxID=2148 RepID=UPI0021F6C593|nr:ABC transporter ATP-binding protein [Acholeplasma laidlawii]